MKTTVSIISLGCPKNQVDAEILLSKIEKAGYITNIQTTLSDIVIINTCGFIVDSKREAIDEILEVIELKKLGQVKKIVVTGCLAQRYQGEIEEEFPEVDVFLGIGSNDKIVEVLDKIIDSDEKICLFGNKLNLPLEGDRTRISPSYTAYLKIAEGCSNCCTYCAIPSIRGKFRSREIENIIEEAKKLATEGVKELILVAQDTTRYGEDLYGEEKLPELLEKLAQINGFRWIRILYAYPERVSDDLLRVMAENENIANYIDIPIQHCNSKILKNMNRPMNEKTLKELIFKIRKKVPGITIRTTVITGFPGETEEQFNELAEFIKYIKFDRLGCFPYSSEEGTVAAKMENHVDDKIIKRRAEVINEMQYDINVKNAKKLIDQKIDVIVEGYDRNSGHYYGRSEADAPEIDFKVFFTSETSLNEGDFVSISVKEVVDQDIIGIAEKEVE